MIPTAPIAATEKADAIVVLTGGQERLEEGFELLAKEVSPKLFITGVAADNITLDKLQKFFPPNFDPSCCVELGPRATDTYGNAQETALWIKKNNFQTIYLVTAAYHMPRSLLEFQYAMPNLRFLAYPVFPQHVKLADIWRYPGSAWLIISEYHKFVIAYAGHHLLHSYLAEAEA
jgi:uncharacterized SAM-binding protein YcdF (DUF218 family)